MKYKAKKVKIIKRAVVKTTDTAIKQNCYKLQTAQYSKTLHTLMRTHSHTHSSVVARRKMNKPKNYVFKLCETCFNIQTVS